MRSFPRSALCVAALSLNSATASWAQASRPFAAELRGGFTRPVPCTVGCDTGDPDEGFAPAFEASLEYVFRPSTSVYGAYSTYRVRRSSSDVFTGSGFGLGLRHSFREDQPVVDPWLRAGLLLHRRTFSREAGDSSRIAEKSDYGPGWEAAVGLSLRITSKLTFVPGIRYQAYTVQQRIRPFGAAPHSIPHGTAFPVLDLGLRIHP